MKILRLYVGKPHGIIYAGSIYTGDKQQQSMILQRKRLTGSLLIIQLKYIKQYMKQGWSMYLHKNREMFRDIIEQTATAYKVGNSIGIICISNTVS